MASMEMKEKSLKTYCIDDSKNEIQNANADNSTNESSLWLMY